VRANDVTELLPARAIRTLGRHFASLKAKGIIEPRQADHPFEDALRFRHILVQEAAYRSLSKERRIELHERFGHWLAGRFVSGGDEVVGYHFEQAYCYRAELGPIDASVRALGDRAADLLDRAGWHAQLRGDDSAAVNLLDRARSLQGNHSRRLALSLRLSESLRFVGKLEQAWSVLGDVIGEAEQRGDRRNEWLARVARAELGTSLAPDEWDDRIQETADSALREFEALGDDHGLARAYALAAKFPWNSCRYDEAAEWYGRALEIARRTGDEREEILTLGSLLPAMHYGSTHVTEVLREAEAFLARFGGPPAHECATLPMLAGLHAMMGEAGESRRLYLRAKSISEEWGLTWLGAVAAQHADEVGLLFEDSEFAERELRSLYEFLGTVGERGFRSTMAGNLAEALYALARYEEAERFADASLELAGRGDIASQARARAVKGKLLAAKDDYETAERLGREAAELSANTDFLYLHGQVLMSLAEVLRLAGRDAEAIPVLQQAAEVSERKGNVVTAQLARRQSGELQATAGS
jgi:tetratricopeptide (TPR) repeat protein